MGEHLTAIVAVCALAFNIALLVLSLLQRLSLSQMKGEVSQLETGLVKAISQSKEEIEERVDRQNREFGEIASAIRQKIHEIETWTRDTFVRRDSFYKVTDDLRGDVKIIDKKIDNIEALVARMEGAINGRKGKGEA